MVCTSCNCVYDCLRSYWVYLHFSDCLDYMLLEKIIMKEDFVLKTDNIVYIGFGFLTLGLIFGALWAKEAWGHYWTWDPKETWAFLTWAVYLIYIHFRIKSNLSHKSVFLILMLAFVVLLICWFGINYLPSAQNSVHVYSS